MAEIKRAYYRYLHEKLAQHFDTGELRALCFNLGIEYEDLIGEGRADKALSLMIHIERRNLVERFVEIVTQSRPDVLWEQPEPVVPTGLPPALEGLADPKEVSVLLYQSLQCVEDKVAVLWSSSGVYNTQLLLLSGVSEKHKEQLLAHSHLMGEVHTRSIYIGETVQRLRVFMFFAFALAIFSILISAVAIFYVHFGG